MMNTNKRTKALIEQCNNESWVCGVLVDSQFDSEKFAELVVDECCLKLLDMDEKAWNHSYYKHASLEIKKHFGVKNA